MAKLHEITEFVTFSIPILMKSKNPTIIEKIVNKELSWLTLIIQNFARIHNLLSSERSEHLDVL